ncbi:unnamed protein product [Closterium sp. NIES-53]
MYCADMRRRPVATSAVFGGEMWPAAEYSRVMYTVRQRVGTLLVRLEKMGGQKIGPWKKDKYLEERAAGNYGDAIREKQMENAALRQEQAEERVAALDKGLQLYKAGKYEEAMQKFQTIIGLVPSYREEAVAFYNIACCCSKLKKVRFLGLGSLGGISSSVLLLQAWVRFLGCFFGLFVSVMR